MVAKLESLVLPCYTEKMKFGQDSSLQWSAGSNTPDDVYITRVINYGTWDEWQNLKQNCPRERIEKVLHRPLRGQWTKRGKAFAETIFDIKLPDEVLISYDV